MGLDSVELLMSWEEYFGVHIPDKEAENIRTVEDAVEVISSHLKLTGYDFTLRNEIFLRLINYLKKTRVIDRTIDYSDLIFEFIPETNKRIWSEITIALKLDVPRPVHPKRSFIRKVFSKLIHTSGYNYNSITFEQLTDVTCAANHEDLINSKVSSKYEVYLIIMALTVDILGVDYYEVLPGRHFVNDFGVS